MTLPAPPAQELSWTPEGQASLQPPGVLLALPRGASGAAQPLTLQMRAMRDTMVFSKNSNSWPVSLKKK